MTRGADDLPDVLHFWEHTWVRRSDVWEGPPVICGCPF